MERPQWMKRFPLGERLAVSLTHFFQGLHYSLGIAVLLILSDLLFLRDGGFLLTESHHSPRHVAGLQIFRLPKGKGSAWLRSLLAEMRQAEASCLSSMVFFSLRVVRP